VHFDIERLDLEVELVAGRKWLDVNVCAFWWKHRVIGGNQPVIQAELHCMFEKTFRHASVGQLLFVVVSHAR